jgi:hypothetical protein
MKRIVLGASLVAALVFSGGTAFAASNPSPTGTGQPSQSCGSATASSMPAGFGTSGFSTAEGVYAGSKGTPSLLNGSSTAVSQYDVACYQVTQNGH